MYSVGFIQRRVVQFKVIFQVTHRLPGATIYFPVLGLLCCVDPEACLPEDRAGIDYRTLQGRRLLGAADWTEDWPHQHNTGGHSYPIIPRGLSVTLLWAAGGGLFLPVLLPPLSWVVCCRCGGC